MSDSETPDMEYEWGGDGSDLNKPVRAHVEAALVPTDAPYPPPVDQLLHIGSALEIPNTGAKIAALGLTQEHVPDLVRMARDRALNTAMSDSDEVWGPIHALTALQDEDLDVSGVAADLVPLFDIDSEWYGEDLPEVLKNAGASALEPLRAYVQDTSRWIFGRAYAISAVEELAKAHPELRDQAVQILSDGLAHAAENDPYVNADFVSALVELRAVESLPVIRQAFEQDLVDESIRGDWSEVLSDLGQQPDPDDPLVRRSRERRGEQQARNRASIPPALRQPAALLPAPTRKPSKANKQKSKRKQSASSRKANKKKRK